MARLILKLAGVVAGLLGLLQCAVIFGMFHHENHTASEIAARIVVLLTVFGMGFLLCWFAWQMWFGPVEKAVDSFSFLAAVLAYSVLSGIATYFHVMEVVNGWLPHHSWWPLVGLVLVGIIFLGPFAFAIQVRRDVRRWFLKQV